MKAIGWLIGILLLVVIGLGVYLVMNSGSLIKTAVETYGPRYLGVDVRLGSAEISLTEGTGELRGLVIGNPEGFDGPHSFSLGLIRLGLDPLGQSETLIRLRNIEVDSADLAMVARGTRTNLQALMANLSSDGGDQAPSEAPQAPLAGKSELRSLPTAPNTCLPWHDHASWNLRWATFLLGTRNLTNGGSSVYINSNSRTPSDKPAVPPLFPISSFLLTTR